MKTIIHSEKALTKYSDCAIIYCVFGKQKAPGEDLRNHTEGLNQNKLEMQMYSKTQSPARKIDTITLTLTPAQFDIFLAALAEAKARNLAIADWTGESAADIEARYQLPHDDILNDMADAFFSQQTGIPMF